jgi:hypothetical protein
MMVVDGKFALVCYLIAAEAAVDGESVVFSQ